VAVGVERVIRQRGKDRLEGRAARLDPVVDVDELAGVVVVEEIAQLA
jgi:hypothetical protein